MARVIRNCKLPVQTLTNWGSAELAFFMREAFLVGEWTENANDGDAAWASASNVIFSDAGAPGFAVQAANPRQVTHSGSPFTQAQVDDGMVLALQATNDQNASMWRMTEFIDAMTVKVDTFGFSPAGWLDESAIPGRILDYGAVHTTGAWVEMDPPGGNNRARMSINAGTYLDCFAQPRAGLGLFTNTPAGAGVISMYDDDDLEIFLNAYFDGNNALFWKYDSGDVYTSLVMWGELEDAATEDTFPGFVFGRNSPSSHYKIHERYIAMLGANTYVAIYAYPDLIAGPAFADSNVTNADTTAGRLLLNGRPGRARLRKIWAVMDDVASDGGFVRGSLPLIRLGHRELPENSPIDGAGNWWHTVEGICVPRNGPLDPYLRRR